MGFLKSLFGRKETIDDWMRAGPWCRCNNCGQEWRSAAIRDDAGKWEDIVPDRCPHCGIEGFVVEIPPPAGA